MKVSWISLRWLPVVVALVLLGSCAGLERQAPEKMSQAEHDREQEELAESALPGGDYATAATEVQTDAPDEPITAGGEEDDGKVVYHKHTVVDFGDDTIDGDLVEPDGAYLMSRRKSRHSSTIRNRESFKDEGLDLDPADPAQSERRIEITAQDRRTQNQRTVAAPTNAQRMALASMARNADELWVIAKSAEDPAPRVEDPTEPGSGELRTKLPGRPELVPLPLKHTDVAAKVAGYLASVRVKQQYQNPYDQKIEAVYVFPLPQNAAVSEFVMVIGDRKIRGIVREKEEAKRIYREARSRGFQAALLTQERPNIFTQKVANIEPGKRIDIDLTYYNTLPYRDGAYTFAFPMVVGPRYNPAGSTSGVGAVPRGRSGSSGQATEVSYLRPDERSGHALSLSVELDAGVSVEGLTSLHHEVNVRELGPNRRKVTLSKQAVIPNKDFILRYEVAGDKIKSALLTHDEGEGGYFALMLQPPKDLKRIRRSPREMIFVLDCSGSMSGVPLDKAKRAVRRVLGLLDEDDTFQIIRFSNDASQLGPKPVPATAANIRRGLKYLESLNGTGGTEMIEGIKAALDFPHEEGKLRLVSFMTDGYIGNDPQILRAVHDKLGASRIFSFGVGAAPNRYLLERMAKMGNGAVAYVTLNDRASDEAVDAFYERIGYPALSDIEIDWGDARVTGVYPSRLPDLHVGRPVILTGRYAGTFNGEIEVRGLAGGRTVSFDVEVESQGEKRPALAKIWARARIADFADRATWAHNIGELASGIKETALSYGIMSAYTAFIAVDSSRRTEGGAGTTVPVAVPVPEGVRYDTTVSNAQR